MSVLVSTERVVKCPTSHCPGWITVRDDRPQTVPCPYCRVTVNTLAYVLEGIADDPVDAAAETRLPPAVHQAFNSLLLRVAGRTGGNVYLRPADRVIAGLVPSTRGVIVEYNVAIGRQAGPAALVALILHPLLHIDLHPREEKPLGLALRAGARDKEALQNAANYLVILMDHPWIAAQIAAIDPALRLAERTWALPLLGMLTGNETFFPPYMADRNRRWIAEQFDASDVTAPELTEALVARLATLSQRFFAGQREDLRRLLIALELAELEIRDPARAPGYQEAIAATGLTGVEGAAGMATHLVADLTAVAEEAPQPDQAAFRRALDAGLKALGLHTAFEVQTLKST